MSLQKQPCVWSSQYCRKVLIICRSSLVASEHDTFRSTARLFPLQQNHYRCILDTPTCHSSVSNKVSPAESIVFCFYQCACCVICACHERISTELCSWVSRKNPFQNFQCCHHHCAGSRPGERHWYWCSVVENCDVTPSSFDSVDSPS